MRPPPKLNVYDFPPDWYVANGIINLSPDVSLIARDFWHTLKESQRGSWIVGFNWLVGRTMRWTADSETIDEGPGIDVGGFRTTEIPTETVETVNGIPLVYILPPEIIAKAKSKTIVQSKTKSGRASFALE